MIARNPSNVKLNRSRKIGSAVESCIQMLEQRTMMSTGPTIASITVNPAIDPFTSPTLLTAVNVAPISGETISNVEFYAEKTTGTVTPATDYDLGSGTASGSNYTLTFTPSSKLPSANTYTIYAQATDAVSNATGTKDVNGNQATGTLTTAPILNFSAPAYYSGIVPSGGKQLTITVNRSGELADPVSVTYTTSDGSPNNAVIDPAATAGTDYASTTGTLSFAANQTSATFNVSISQPNTGVGSKVFTITLSSPTGSSGGIINTPTGTTTGTAAVLIDQTPRAFQPGDAVVEVGGNGATPLLSSNGTNAVYLYEYNTSGGLVQAFPVYNTQTASGSNRALMAGNSGFEALVGNSLDGQNVLLGGYNGTTANSYSFGIVNSSGGVNTSTGINSSVSLSVPRGLTSPDDSSLYWTSSSGTYGLQEINLGTVASASNAVNVSLGTPRALSMDHNGDNFSDSTSTGKYLGYDPNNSTTSFTLLPGFTSANAGACTQFAFASNISEDDTIYLQNGTGNTSPSAIEKFSLTGTNATPDDGYAAGTPVTLAEEVLEIQNGESVRGTWVLESTTPLPSGTVINPEGLGLTVNQTSPTNVQIFDTLAPFNVNGNNSQGSTTRSLLFSLTDTFNLTTATPDTNSVTQLAALPGNGYYTGTTPGSGTGSTLYSTAEFHCVANAPVAAGVAETTAPQSQNVSSGQTVIFTAWAGQQNEPSAPVTGNTIQVQWYQVSGGSTVALSHQNSTTLKLTATDALNGAQYYAVFSNLGTGAQDGSEYRATLTVNDAPYVTSVSPNAGPLHGNVSVTLTGNNFIAGSTVSFQGIAGTITPTSITPTSLTFTAPAEAAGTYDVQVNNANGTSPATSAQTFTYLAGPEVTGISPATGPDGGGTTVVITGTSFISGATVTFGGVAATSVTFNSPTQITAVSPAAANPATTVDVVVTESVSGSPLSSAIVSGDQFAYTRGTVAQADTLAVSNPAGNSVLLDNFPIVTAILQHIGVYGSDTYTNEEFLIDDGTASIMAVANAATLGSYVPTVGDELKISGTASFTAFPLLPQLQVSAGSISLLASNHSLPANFDPTITLSQISGNPTPLQFTSQLVTIQNATIDNIPATGATFGGSGTGNLTISDASDPYIPANGMTPASGGLQFNYDPGHIGISYENLDGLPVPTGSNVTITGIVENSYGTIQFVPISLPGNSERFSFNTSQGANSLASDKTVNPNAVSDGFSSVARGGSFTITVNRLESVPAGGTADTGTVNLVLTAETGVAGVDFSVTGYNAQNGALTIPVSFAPGQSTATFTVNTSGSSSGSKLFSISLSGASSSNPGSPANPNGFDVSTTSNPLTVVVEDNSANQVDAFAAVSNEQQSELANIEANSQPGDDALQIESSSQGQYADYGIMTFNDNAYDPTDILNSLQGAKTVESINGLQFEAVPTRNGFDTAGTLNVYIITDNSHVVGNSNNTYPTTGLSFNSSTTTGILGTADPATGIISGASGLGTLYPLGSIAYDPNLVQYGAENVFSLTTSSLDALGTQLLAADITQNNAITIVIAPGDNNVAATFAGYVNTSKIYQTSPNLRIQYSTALPTWVSTTNSDANSQTVYIAPSNSLVTTGAATITTTTSAPSAFVSGASASLSINSTPSSVSLTGLKVINGASAAFTGTSPQTLVVGSGGLIVDPTSSFTLGNNYLNIGAGFIDLQAASPSQGASLYSALQSQIISGNAGSYGIRTSVSTLIQSLGESTGAQYASTLPGVGTIGANDAIVRNTYYGDANLDGAVTSVDYTIIDNSFLTEQSTHTNVTGWSNGDFNLDAVVNGSDYTLMDNAFNTQGASLGAPAAQIAASAAPTSIQASSSSNDSFFSDKKVKSLASDLEDLITAG
jgi:hypothetical protein